MTRMLVTPGLVLLLPLSGLIVLFGMFGSGAHRGRTLQEFSACSVPCWNGITPQETSLDAADAILSQVGFIKRSDPLYQAFEPTAYYYRPPADYSCTVALLRKQDVVTAIILTECDSVLLGDVIAVLGHPQAIVPSWSNANLIYVLAREMLARPFSNTPSVTALMFPGQSAMVTVNSPLCKSGLSLDTEVWSIHLDPALRDPAAQNLFQDFLDWHGFIPLWRYHQLYPGMLTC